MHYYIYCNQKNISSYAMEALKEYSKRLSSYCKISLILQPERIVPDSFHKGNHMIAYIKRGISSYSSEEFANQLHHYEQSGKSNLHIYIGYTYEELFFAFQNQVPIDFAEISLSNSGLSVKNQCILLYEQIYRGYTILQGKTYHK